MQKLRQTVFLYAKSPATVLIQGETGTGKELAAQAIHSESQRARQAFVAINCGAVAESLLESELFGYEEGAFTGSRRGGHAGLFESAHRGTLFLDEIGEMPLPLQTRLLRVLEEREIVRVGGTRPIPVDVRIVCASHCDLDARVRTGQFRADLFYRLSVLRMNLPPLRERADDIAPLAEWHLKNALAALSVRPHANLHAEVLACAPLLNAYAWPGNIRELRNLMERLALFLAAEPLQALTPSFVLTIAPELVAIGDSSHLEPSRSDADDIAIHEDYQQVLARFKGNRQAAADYLGISRTTLWRKLQGK
jgi:propionate catabolism operon transcriptional regulator